MLLHAIIRSPKLYKKYFYIGTIILAASGAVAIYLNFQGVKCLSDLAQVDISVLAPEHLEEMERNCSIITNSYVYSLYGIIIGITLIVIGLVKKRKSMRAF
ncbi:MAG: hypothetical protein M3M91_03165 [Thermoproteota archaeon]|nr:hypothetical protein [Thermoproteota archaeon]